MRNIESLDQAFVNKEVLEERGKKSNEKPQCYECKGFGYMRNECPNFIKEEENHRKKEKEMGKERGKEKEKKEKKVL